MIFPSFLGEREKGFATSGAICRSILRQQKNTLPPHRLAASFLFKEIAPAREVQICLSRTVGFEKEQRA